MIKITVPNIDLLSLNRIKKQMFAQEQKRIYVFGLDIYKYKRSTSLSCLHEDEGQGEE